MCWCSCIDVFMRSCVKMFLKCLTELWSNFYLNIQFYFIKLENWNWNWLNHVSAHTKKIDKNTGPALGKTMQKQTCRPPSKTVVWENVKQKMTIFITSTRTHQHIDTSTHQHINTSTHQHISTSAHLHIYTSTHRGHQSTN